MRGSSISVLVASALLVLTFGPAFSGAAVLRVRHDADGAGTGATWDDAFPRLELALAEAGPGDEIWVAAGTYKPTGDGDREAAFELADRVAVYGGFAGGEDQRDTRNSEANVTILSGDLDGNDTDAPVGLNSYHVLRADGCTAGTRLDGFVITGGIATSGTTPHYRGGGMYVTESELDVANCDFRHNHAKFGGGIYCLDSTVRLSSGDFSDQEAWDGGGAVYANPGTHLVINDCSFGDNRADYGGAIDHYGTYSGTGDLAVIDCRFTGNHADMHGGAVYCSDVPSDMQGCTFTGNQADEHGGALYLDGKTHGLRRCAFDANQAWWRGGALYFKTDRLEAADCTFERNRTWRTSGGYGGALYAYDGIAYLHGCRFQGNVSTTSGGAVYNSFASVYAACTVFAANRATYGGGIYAEDRVELVNCTVCANRATSEAGGLWSDARLTVHNGILWDNRDGGGADEAAQLTATGTTTVERTCIQDLDTLAGNANTDADPQFVALPSDGGDGWDPWGPVVNDTYGDLRLDQGSPLVDAGDNALLPADATDMDNDGDTAEPIPLDAAGLPRRQDDHNTADTGNGTAPLVELGAYELEPINGFVLTPAVVTVPEGGTAEVQVAPVLAPDADLPVAVAFVSGDSNLTVQSGLPLQFGPGDQTPKTIVLHAAPDGDAFNGSAIFHLSADGAATATLHAAEADGQHAGTPVMVDAAAPGSGDGSSWPNAFTTLQAAIDAAPEGAEIWVAQGRYEEAVAPKSQVALLGGFAGGEQDAGLRDPRLHAAVLSGDDPSRAAAAHVVTLVDVTDVTLDGFTIEGGHASGAGDTDDGRGAGLFCRNAADSVLLRNCTITDNRAARGAGMYLDNSPITLEHCVFRRNSVAGTTPESSGGDGAPGGAGGQGAGLFAAASDARFIACLFDGNSAAGGMGESPLDSVSYSYDGGNGGAGGSGGAIHAENSALLLVNCVLVANLARGGAGGAGNSTNATPGVGGDGGPGGQGGALFATGDPLPTVVNCTFHGNAADGGDGGQGGWSISGDYYADSGASGADGDGGAMHAPAAATAANTIFSDNAPAAIGGGAGSRHGLFRNSAGDDAFVGSDGNVAGDPAFADSANRDFSLGIGTAAMDRGDDGAVPAGITTDAAGAARIQGAAVDIGAHENALVWLTMTDASPLLVAEDAGSVAVNVALVGQASSAVSVTCATVEGQAKAGQDYAAVSEVFTWQPGENHVTTLSVPILTDQVTEPDERFTVALSGADGVPVCSAATEVVILGDPGVLVVGPDGPWATINAALAAADPGNLIWLRPGAYDGATIDKAVSIVGEGRPLVGGLKVTADNVTIRDVLSWVAFVGVQDCVVRNCAIDAGGPPMWEAARAEDRASSEDVWGIDVLDSSRIRIEKCQASGFWTTGDPVWENGFVTSGDLFGIRLRNSTDCVITGCTITNMIGPDHNYNGETSAFGIALWGSHRCLIAGNTVSGMRNGADNDDTGSPEACGVRLHQSNFNQILGNQLSDSQGQSGLLGNAGDGSGVHVSEGTGNAIVANQLSQHHGGIAELAEHGVGAGVWLESDGNEAYFNGFSDNQAHIVAVGGNVLTPPAPIPYRIVDTRFHGLLGNHYADHDLTDSDGDGITDATFGDDGHPLAAAELPALSAWYLSPGDLLAADGPVHDRETVSLPAVGNHIWQAAEPELEDRVFQAGDTWKVRLTFAAPPPAGVAFAVTVGAAGGNGFAASGATAQITADGVAGAFLAETAQAPVTVAAGERLALRITHSGDTDVALLTGGTWSVLAAPNPDADAPPIIATHPESTDVEVGDEVELRVIAYGSPPLSYQWHKDGVPVAVADSAALVLNDVALADAGAYSCLVRNAFAPDGVLSDPAQLSVSKRVQTIAFDPLPAKTFGDAPFAPGAAASSGLPVSYASSAPGVATVTGDQLTIVGAGTTIVTASQAGDTTYDAATPVDRTLTVTRAAQTITFDALTAVTYGDGPLMLAPVSDQGLTVSLASDDPAVATISGHTVTIVGAGNATLTASQAGNANVDAAADVVRELVVDKARQVIDFAITETPTWTDSVPLSATGGGSGLPVTFAVLTGPGAIDEQGVLTFGDVGAVTVQANQAGDANHLPATTVEAAVTAGKATPSLTWPDPAAIPFGTPLGPAQLNAAENADLPGAFEYDPPAGTVLGVPTLPAPGLPGIHTLHVTFRPNDGDRYTEATAAAAISLLKAPLTVVVGDGERRYGAPNPAFYFTYQGGVDGYPVEGIDTAPAPHCEAGPTANPGQYPVGIRGGSDDIYDFVAAPGTLTVTEGIRIRAGRGWELLSLPYAPDGTNPAPFGSAARDDTCGPLWGWDAAGCRFCRLDGEFDQPIAFWGHFDEPFQTDWILPSAMPGRDIPLPGGWALVGVPLNVRRADLVCDRRLRIWGWDPDRRRLVRIAPGDTLLRGRGYWVHTEGVATATIP